MMKIFSIPLAACLCMNLAIAHAQDMAPPHAHAPAADHRVILALSPDERVMILEEMRLFLDGVGAMTGALTTEEESA